MSTIDQKQALLLNFTASTYHWGCYGTSMEVWTSLVERGYYVEMVNVREIHLLEPTPQQLKDFDQAEFGIAFLKANPRIYHMLLSSDVVYVNGEGTLHGPNKAAINLLYLMYMAKINFKKPVYLINSSFFPADNGQAHDQLDAIYGHVARVIDPIVPREAHSLAVLARLGVTATQGFDCLPRFIHRHGLIGSHEFTPTVVVAGGVNMTQAQTLQFGQALNKAHQAGTRCIFLTGAKAMLNSEDARIFEALQSVFPAITCVNAQSMREWLEVMARAACVVSARFHHSLAAVSLGTPCLVFPSNTPKTHAAMQMLGVDTLPSLSHDMSVIGDFVSAALQQHLQPIAPKLVAHVVELASHNFFETASMAPLHLFRKTSQ